MPTKVNIVLDEDVKSELERLVESGMRSRVINKALRQELQSIRRQKSGSVTSALISEFGAVTNMRERRGLSDYR